MVDGLIEHLTHLIMILRLPKDPHELCHGGFQGHIVGLDETKGVFDLLADLVDGHVAAFLGNLCCHDHSFSKVDPMSHCTVVVASVIIRRKSANAKGLNDHCIIMSCHIVQKGSVCRWDQLHQSHTGVHLVIESQRLCDLRLVV